MKNVVAVIPARFGSTRFPGKLLAKKTGKYLIEHVYEQVCRSELIDKVMIATDDDRIVDACAEFGAECRMTRADHLSGTDRIAEVAEHLEVEIIVNVQGDEPEIEPGNVDRLVELLRQDSQADMATLSAVFGMGEDIHNPNVVKVVTDRNGHALYFSRWPIPFQRDKEGQKPTYYKHLGIYGYRRDVLLKLSKLKPTPLELAEKLEQLRALENGFVIAVTEVEHAAVGIDTAQQYDEFVSRIGNSEKRN